MALCRLLDDGLGEAIDIAAELDRAKRDRRPIATALPRPANPAPRSIIRPRKNRAVPGLS
jgi:hypothetical protein